MLNDSPKATQSLIDKAWARTHVFRLLTYSCLCHLIHPLWMKAKTGNETRTLSRTETKHLVRKPDESTSVQVTILCFFYKMGILMPALYTPEECLKYMMGIIYKELWKAINKMRGCT